MACRLYSLNTSQPANTHPRAKTIASVLTRSVFLAQRIAALRVDEGWSYDRLGAVLALTKGDAYRLCNGGKATAEQHDMCLAHAKRAA
jgi:hypothetical protein